MHVMVANNIYPPIMAGGAERIVAYLCEGLVEKGHRVTVVSTCGPEMEPYPTEMRNGVEVIRFFPPNVYWSFSRNRAPGLKKWVWHARDAWNEQAGEHVQELLAKAQPDILHTHLIDGFSASIWAAASRSGIPVIHTAHDYHLLCPRAIMMTADGKVCTSPRLTCQMYRQWHLWTTRYVDYFASPSRFLLRLHEHDGLRVPRRGVIHNGIPLPNDRDVVRRSRSPESRMRFLMLTRLTVEKGVQVVLDAVKQLPRDLPIEVTIAGTGPLEAQVRAASLQDHRINYLGFVDGPAKKEALSHAGTLLLPSLWYENAPVTIVEAAAYGLGIIASDIGAIPEFVEKGQTGLLFPPGNATVLADLMMRTIRDPHCLPSLASRSQAWAQRFAAERMIESYEEHYHMLLDQRAAYATAM